MLSAPVAGEAGNGALAIASVLLRGWAVMMLVGVAHRRRRPSRCRWAPDESPTLGFLPIALFTSPSGPLKSHGCAAQPNPMVMSIMAGLTAWVVAHSTPLINSSFVPCPGVRSYGLDAVLESSGQPLRGVRFSHREASS
jgi:hypothetical protein